MSASYHSVPLAELEHAHETLAMLAAENPVYLPIFARLEAELILSRVADDPVEKARAMLAAQRAVV